MTEAASLAISAFDAVCRERDEAKAAIKAAYWQLLPFLKPGDEKTKAVLERLQKFL